MRRILRDNGLSLVLFGLFFFTFIFGQTIAGHREYNHEQQAHGQPTLSYGQYLRSSHFVEATMENWESEFLQMFTYVVLTVFLVQKGSAESKKLDEPEAVDRDPKLSQDELDVPWPVRTGGWVLKLYEHSLSLAFLLLFITAFVSMRWVAPGNTVKSSSSMANRRSRPSPTLLPHASGLSPFRTGRVSFWQWGRWSSSPSFCGKKVRRNQSRWIVRIARPVTSKRLRVAIHEAGYAVMAYLIQESKNITAPQAHRRP